jgi:hypothetical protein
VKAKSFWSEWAQGDLFPDRSTVGQEFVADMLAVPNVSGHLTEAGRRPNGANNRGRQKPLPLTSARRDTK